MANFGQRLRRLRGDRSQKEVAGGLRMPATTLSSLEGQPNVPRGEVVQKLASFFRVPITYFYSDSPPAAKATDAARQYLKQLLQPTHGAETVATQSNVLLNDDERKKLAELLNNNAKTSNE
jgi:transcriptional regulator with XRE-family HTH domain